MRTLRASAPWGGLLRRRGLLLRIGLRWRQRQQPAGDTVNNKLFADAQDAPANSTRDSVHTAQLRHRQQHAAAIFCKSLRTTSKDAERALV